MFLHYRGLLTEKEDDSLFFLDVGQQKKPTQKGKYMVLCFNYESVSGLTNWQPFSESESFINQAYEYMEFASVLCLVTGNAIVK